MKTIIQLNNKSHTVDLAKPLDISLALQPKKDNPNAWYIGHPKIEPVILEDWIASVKEGASINFNNIYFKMVLFYYIQNKINKSE